MHDPLETPLAAPLTSDETLLLLNRATLVMHAMRTAAHELNNVFQMLSGSTELLELNPECPAFIRPKLETMARQTNRGRDLVGAMADMARSKGASASSADVGLTIDRVCQLRKYEHARSLLEFVVRLPTDGQLIVRTDPMDLQLMLLNLVINAEQAVAEVERKSITVAATRSGTCEIVVSDSGQGKLGSADYFSPLFTTRSPAVASGLGLAATKVLAERNRGSIALRQGSSGVEAVLTLPM